MEMTVKNILAGEILTEFDIPSDYDKLKEIYAKIENVGDYDLDLEAEKWQHSAQISFNQGPFI